MTKITFVQPDGTRVTVDAVPGDSVMSAAVAADVAGILGQCGGNLMCGTCHVYVAEPLAYRLAAVTEEEEQMLACAVGPRRANSRLGCRLPVTEDLDGLVLTVPDCQT